MAARASAVVIGVDLAIVGGGPAGAAAALRARAIAPRRRIALVDAADFPRDKVCGDGIGPEGLAALRSLGASSTVADAPRLDRLRVVAPSGREVSGNAPRPGVVVRRRLFDARLHELAVDAGAIVIHHRVRRVRTKSTHVQLDDRVRARLVIAADGAHSTIARTLRPPPPRNQTGLAMRGYARWPDLDALTIWFVEERWPAYAWAFPLGDGNANIGYGPFDATTVGTRRDLEGTIDEFFADKVDQVSPLAAHHLPLSPARSTLGRGRCLLAGDAANLVHPLTGEGIYYALLTGAMAGEAATRHLVDGRGSPAAVYRRAVRSRLGRHLHQTDLGARMLRSSLGVEVAVAAAAADPTVLAALTEFAFGTGRINRRIVTALTHAWLKHRPFDVVRAHKDRGRRSILGLRH